MLDDSLEELAPIRAAPSAGSFNVRNQVVLAFCATTGSFAVGMALAWSSPVLPKMEHLSLEEVSWIGSLIALGAVCGGLPGGWMMERFGRKASLLYLSLPFALGWICLMTDGSVFIIYVGRFILGFCCACCLVIVPTYIAETAHSTMRGKLGSLMQVMIVCGVLASYAFGWVLPWVWLSVLCCSVTVLFAIFMSLVPESPVYLLKHGQQAEARRVLSHLRGPGYDVSAELAEAEREDAEIKRAGPAGIRDFANPGLYKPLAVSVGLMLNQQFCGVNNIIFYTASIFKSTGSSLDENLASVLVGIVQVVATIISASVVDKLGRKPLLFLSNVFGAISMYFLGLYFWWQTHPGDYPPDFAAHHAWVSLTAVITFMIAFSFALGPVPWLMMGELFPARFRGLASGTATMLNWLAAFATTKTFSTFMSAFGLAQTFWIYAGMQVIGAFFVVYFVPETKGRTLKEIASFFGSKLSSRDFNDSI